MPSLKAELQFIKTKSFLSLTSPKGSALVLGLTQSDGKATPVSTAKGGKELQTAYNTLSGLKGFDGKAESVTTLLHHSSGLAGLPRYSHLVGFGVGGPGDCHSQNILSWGGRLGRLVRDQKIDFTDIYLESLYNGSASANGKDSPKDFAGRRLPGGTSSREDFLEKLAIGIYLGLYTFTRYKSKKEETKVPTIRIVSDLIDEKKAKAVFEKAAALAEACYLTRDLQTTPGGDMRPPDLAKRAQEAGRESGFKVTVFDEKKLASEGMNGILTVGKGSDAPPRFIIMEHNAGKKNVPTVVLIGKGVTFDTGGICIKPAGGMEEMKYDMSGSASVIGAMHALATLNAPVHVVGLVASAENMINGSAVRPGDVYTAFGGKTVEVINTDAEGRLVLADALEYAKKYKPDAVIDIATLTGAVGIALGAYATGLMGNNAALIDAYVEASGRAGERCWELPLFEEYKEDLRSKVSDYKNVGDRTAGSQKGGTFLNFFVDGAYPWIHLDVAMTADTPKGQGSHCPPDVGTAVPVRGLVEFTMNVASYFKTAK